jgi:glycosyltransferase involved in cell wall biosynthesis
MAAIDPGEGEATVSAVIPVHNGEAFIEAAIESALSQTTPVLECIVVDDGSTDATSDVVRGFGDAVTYVSQPRSGVSAARNRGTREARGDFVAFLDHDDVWLPEKLERQLALLLEPDNASAIMALCAVRMVDASGICLGIRRLHARGELIQGMFLFDGTEIVSCSSTGLLRREPLIAAGGFDETLSTSADWDLLLRLLLASAVVYVDEALALYRVHAANMSRSVGATERDMRYAFAKAFADPRLPSTVRGARRKAYASLYRMLAGSYLHHGAWTDALRTAALAIWKDPRTAVDFVRRGAARRVRSHA